MVRSGLARKMRIRILDVFKRADIPVHVGAAQPLARGYARKGWGVHGADGLGGIGLPPPTRAVDGTDAVGWMAGILEEATPKQHHLGAAGAAHQYRKAAAASSQGPALASRK